MKMVRSLRFRRFGKHNFRSAVPIAQMVVIAYGRALFVRRARSLLAPQPTRRLRPP